MKRNDSPKEAIWFGWIILLIGSAAITLPFVLGQTKGWTYWKLSLPVLGIWIVSMGIRSVAEGYRRLKVDKSQDPEKN